MLYQEPIRWKRHYRTVRNAIFMRGPSRYQMQSYYYMNSYYKDKTVWRQSYRYNGIFTPGKAVLILGLGKFHVLLVGITGIPSLIARSMGPIWGRQGLSGPHVGPSTLLAGTPSCHGWFGSHRWGFDHGSIPPLNQRQNGWMWFHIGFSHETLPSRGQSYEI